MANKQYTRDRREALELLRPNSRREWKLRYKSYEQYYQSEEWEQVVAIFKRHICFLLQEAGILLFHPERPVCRVKENLHAS